MAKMSFADKINALINTRPNFDSDDEPEETKAKVVEHHDESGISEDEYQQSKIRKRNINTLDEVDERYAGKKTSRKDIYSEDDTSEAAESEDDEEEEEEEEQDSKDDEEDTEGSIQKQSDELDDSEEADSQQSEESEEDAEDAENISDEDQDDDDMNINDSLDKQENFTIETMSKTNIKEQIEKSNCVRSQLKNWDYFLEMRIKMQKCLVISNQMPQYDTHKQLRSNTSFVNKVNETKVNLSQVLSNMLQLKDLLLKQYPETKSLCSSSRKRKAEKKRNKNSNQDDPMDEEIPSDTEDELGSEGASSISEDTEEDIEETVPRKLPKYNDYEKILQESHTSYVQYRDSIIKKWNDKTRLANKVNKSSTQNSTLKQIEFAMNNMDRLRKKTQLKRTEYNVIGKSTSAEGNDDNRTDEYDAEIFDDDDFYHQLLRDLIEYKSSTDSVQLSRRWTELQNIRRKMKKKVDTRATKGRKIRYKVINKLISFMGVINTNNKWIDKAKDELACSMFGKIKSTEDQPKNVDIKLTM